MFLHIKIKKSKIYQEFANFCEISLFIYFIFLVIKLFLPGGGGGGGGGGGLSMVVWLLDFH
jgi:hypothetical protein